MGAWVALAAAAVGAYSSYSSAQAANKPKKGVTDQTTTQTPYGSDQTGPDINAVLNYQRGIAQRGAPHLDSHGNVYYDPIPGVSDSTGGGTTPTPVPKTPPGGIGKKPTTWTNAKGQLMSLDSSGKVVPASGSSTSTSSMPSTTPQYTNAPSILSQVAQRGFDTGKDPTVLQAKNVMSNVWGDSANPGGSVGGTEQTGFEGYNPILDRLAGTVEGNVDSGNGTSRNLLLDFLGQGGGDPGTPRSGNTGNSGGAGGGGGFGGGTGGAYYTSTGGTYHPNSFNSGGVPDTMAPSSFFGDQTKKLFDDQANSADIQTMIDAMNADAQRGMYADKAAIDAASQGSGRLGGDTWKGMSNDAERTADTAMLNNAANVRVGQHNQTIQQRLAALGLVNQRDLGLLDANTSANNASLSAAASGANNAASIAAAERGQNLNAIESLQGGEQFNQSQLGQLGSQVSSDRLGSLGMVPGLEGIGLSGLQDALGAGGQYVDILGQQAGIRQAQIGASVQRQGLNQQLGIYNASQDQNAVNNYLATIAGIGGMGGTSHTSGTNVVPGLGVSPTGSAILGGIGGAAAGYGAYQQYHG